MNTLKKIEQEQNALMVDEITMLNHFTVPKSGWIKTLRIALFMSGASLARRMGLQRSTVAYLEQSERSGTITLKKIQQVAQALGFEFVYALVPKSTKDKPKPLIDDILRQQAQNKAKQIVSRASAHMALESQILARDLLIQEIERLTKKLLDDIPKDFWELD